jgi:hypothetical protein
MKSSKDLDPVPQSYSVPAKGPECKLTLLSSLGHGKLLTTNPDDPALNDGAPCSIQIVARRFQDEKCLAAARVIEAILRR